MAAAKIEYSDNGEALASICLDVEDFEEASRSLLELKSTNKKLTREVTLKILRERIGDVFYRALAFDVLYSAGIEDAVAYIESDGRTESAYVLGAMIDVVTEDFGALTGRDKALKAVSALGRVLEGRPQEDDRSIAIKRARFEEAWRDRIRPAEGSVAFILTYVDKKPMRLKGKIQFAGMAVSDTRGKLPPGPYRGMRSGQRITVTSAGGQVFPGSDAALAIALTHPIPITTDESVSGIGNSLDEVFVMDGNDSTLQECRFDATPLQDEVRGHWIPVDFFRRDVQIGKGWIKQRDAAIDVILVGDKESGEIGPCRVVPIYIPEAAFDIG
jgi:hypothetical protein